MATIQVFRPATRWRDRARKYEFLVDGTQHAKIAHGQTVRLDVPAGRHSVEAKLDWKKTPALELDIAEGETAEVRMAPGPIVNIFRPSTYLVLERVEQDEARA